MDGNELFNEWREHSQEYMILSDDEVALNNFDYRDKDQGLRVQVIIALAFWKFLKRSEGGNDSFLLSLAKSKGPYNERIKNIWIERKEKLSVLMEKFEDYPLIIYILKLESLPTELLQRALWACNIDFTSVGRI